MHEIDCSTLTNGWFVCLFLIFEARKGQCSRRGHSLTERFSDDELEVENDRGGRMSFSEMGKCSLLNL